MAWPKVSTLPMHSVSAQAANHAWRAIDPASRQCGEVVGTPDSGYLGILPAETLTCKPLYLYEPVFSFANKVLRLLAPESLSSHDLPDSSPIANCHFIGLSGTGQMLGAPMAATYPHRPECMQMVLRCRMFSEGC